MSDAYRLEDEYRSPAAPLVAAGPRDVRYLFRLAILVFIGYYAGARLGLALTFQPLPISVLWPPNAILFAALLLAPIRAWWVVLAAAFPAHLLSELQGGIPFAMVMSWYVSNITEALIGAGVLRAFIGQAPPLATLRNVMLFLVAAMASVVLSSFLDSAFVQLNDWGEKTFWEVWVTRLFSNSAADVVLIPAIIAIAGMGRPVLAQLNGARFGEALALALGVMGVTMLVFTTNSALVAPPAEVCLPLPFLLWAALRFGPSGTSLAFAVVMLGAIWGAGHGTGALGHDSPLTNAHSVQLLALALGPTLLCLAAAIAERERAEEAIRSSVRDTAALAQRMAQAARLTALGELAASIAHEINQPMTAVLANAAAAARLLKAPEPQIDEVRTLVDDIRADNRRAAEIVRHIRGLVDRREAEAVPFDLNEVVRAVVRLVTPAARDRGVAIRAEYAQLPPARGDSLRVEQVVLNLILNGMDAMRDTPERNRILVVSTAHDGDSAVSVSLRDYGHGIEAAHESLIFDSFFTTKNEGMGLGLSISRSLVLAQGGRIWAANNADGGATFTFTLPTDRG